MSNTIFFSWQSDRSTREGRNLIENALQSAVSRIRDDADGWLVVEISGSIADDVKSLLSAWHHVASRPDLQSIPRVVRAQKPLAP